MEPNVSCRMQISDFRLLLHLGNTDKEQRQPQEVSFSITVRFSELPKAMTTDFLHDTVCYEQLTDRIRNRCQNRSYHLIEHLAFDCYADLEETLLRNTSFHLCVTKLRPPVEGLHGGAKFCVGNLPCES